MCCCSPFFSTRGGFLPRRSSPKRIELKNPVNCCQSRVQVQSSESAQSSLGDPSLVRPLLGGLVRPLLRGLFVVVYAQNKTSIEHRSCPLLYSLSQHHYKGLKIAKERRVAKVYFAGLRATDRPLFMPLMALQQKETNPRKAFGRAQSQARIPAGAEEASLEARLRAAASIAAWIRPQDSAIFRYPR